MTHDKREKTDGTDGNSSGSDPKPALSLQPLTEQELWEYACSPPDPAEQDRILLRMVFDPEAQERLGQIRQTIAADTQRVNVIAAAQERAMQALHALGRELSSVAAVFVMVGNELVTALGVADSPSGRMAFQPVTLGGDKSGETIGAPEWLTGPSGMSVALSPLSAGHFKIAVRIDPPVEGKVALFKLETKDGKETAKQIGIRATLKNGHALLPSCPTGVIKITAPDSREMILCLESDAW